MNEPNMKLGRLLFNIRTEQGLSLREFCEGLAISHAYLNKLEKGVDPRTGKDVTPTIETLSKIALGINMPLQELLATCGYLDAEIGEGIEDAIEEPEKEEIETDLALEDLVNEVCEAINLSETISFCGKPVNSKSEVFVLMARELINIGTSQRPGRINF